MVSIRGTLSLEDCVTDFMCEPVDLDEWIEEVKEEDSREQPRSFSDRVPEVKPASRFHAPVPGAAGTAPPPRTVCLRNSCV